MNYLQAQEGLQRARDRQKKYQSMTTEEMESKLRQQEDWIAKNPNHPRLSELQSACGHLKMIYFDRTGEQNVKDTLW